MDLGAGVRALRLLVRAACGRAQVAFRARTPALRVTTGFALCVLAVATQVHAFDLSRATRERLGNGLTVLVLEEHALPVVSVQMLYRTGARDEVTGRTGLAHFVEHMAFRASENFPATDLVSRIYAVGGEWHGYTWIDQTTYFETLPREQLDLALAIEADRMARLLLPAAELEAERGAVLAELHGYENDPATVLTDAVLAVSFLQHPYRNNTIGWESDVVRLTRDDVAAFYRAHYRPADAVLAVVGDAPAAEVLAAVRRRFGDLPAGEPSPPPRTVEPPQRGERRVELRGGPGAGGAARQRSLFEIAYRAPAASDPDYPAFLLLRELLGGTGGVNFRQDDFGRPVADGTRLAGAGEELSTWAPPSAYPYVFTVSGSADPATPRGEVEAAIEERLTALRDEPAPAGELDSARRRLLAELVFDLETTEDAAHQLAFFAGIDALDVLLHLPERLAAVGPDEVRRVAAEILRPEGRTVGWWLAGESDGSGGKPTAMEATPGDAGPGATAPPRLGEAGPPTPAGVEDVDGSSVAGGQSSATAGWRAGASPDGGEAGPANDRAGVPSSGVGPVEPPVAFRLPSGLPVLFQRSPLSPAGYLRIVVPSRAYELPASAGADLGVDDPVWRHASLGFRFLRDDLAGAVAAARRALEAGRPDTAATEGDTSGDGAATAGGAASGGASGEEVAAEADPESALRAALADLLGVARPPEDGPVPVLLAVAGDLDAEEVRRALTASFGDLAPGGLPAAPPPHLTAGERSIHLPGLVQAQLGYAVPAPPPADREATVWQLLLYILSHDYEGRLGIEAISRRGLVYYIGSDYACDGKSGWISLEMGVDPENLPAMRALLAETLAGLSTRPPTEAELAEAKAHLLGRRATAAQSNAELTARLAREAICEGGPLADAAYRRAVETVRRDDLLRIVPAFTAGAVATVE